MRGSLDIDMAVGRYRQDKVLKREMGALLRQCMETFLQANKNAPVKFVVILF